MLNFDFLKQYSGTPLSLIVTAFFIGILIALFAIFYERNVPGTLVRKLIKAKAHSEENAKTLKELACDNIFIRFAIRDKSTLNKIVKKIKGEKKSDDRFYIPEELRIRAEIRYRKKGNDLIALIAALAILAILAVVIDLYGQKIIDLMKFLINF